MRPPSLLYASVLLFFFLPWIGFSEEGKPPPPPSFSEWIRKVPARKTHQYLNEGTFIGGDAQTEEHILESFQLLSLPQKKGERLLIQLKANQTLIPSVSLKPSSHKVPYYQISLDPIRNQILFELTGNLKFSSSFKSLQNALSQSQLIEKALLFPRLEEEVWSFVLQMNQPIQLEAIEPLVEKSILVDILPKTR